MPPSVITNAATNKLTSIFDSVRDAVLPLANVPYDAQLTKKAAEARAILDAAKAEFVATNAAARTWCTHQESRYQYFLELDGVRGCSADGGGGDAGSAADGYRVKADFSVGVNPGSGKLTVGLMPDPADPTVVGPVNHLRHFPQRMKLVVRLLEAFMRESNWQPFDPFSSSGVWMGATVRLGAASGQARLVVAVNTQAVDKSQIKEIKDRLVHFFSSAGPGASAELTSLYVNARAPWDSGAMEHLRGNDFVEEALLGKTFRISSRSYFAVNPRATEVLYQAVDQLLHLHPQSTLIDVCCGTGSLGIALSDRCGQVLGVDVLPEAVSDARRNALANGATNAEFLVGAAEDALPNVWKRVAFAEAVVVVDPPRAGLDAKAIGHIRKNSAIKKLVYVASDPKAAVKNFTELSRAPSNNVEGDPLVPVRAVPVDTLPHTNHFAVVVLFMRASMADLLHPQNVDFSKYYHQPKTSTSAAATTPAAPPKQPPKQPPLHNEPQPDLAWQAVVPLKEAVAAAAADKGAAKPKSTSAAASAAATLATARGARNADEASLNGEQLAWLNQMTEMYGGEFERAQWVTTFHRQNEEYAAGGAGGGGGASSTAEVAKEATTTASASSAAASDPAAAAAANENAWAKYSKDYSEWSAYAQQPPPQPTAGEQPRPPQANQPPPPPQNKNKQGTAAQASSDEAWKTYCAQMSGFWSQGGEAAAAAATGANADAAKAAKSKTVERRGSGQLAELLAWQQQQQQPAAAAAYGYQQPQPQYSYQQQPQQYWPSVGGGRGRGRGGPATGTGYYTY